jgi:outer membrane protein TolC
MKTALTENLTLQAAMTRFEEAQHAGSATHWSLAPKAGLDAKSSRANTNQYQQQGYGSQTIPPVSTMLDSFSVSWELPLFGKAAAVWAQGKAQGKQARWQGEAARLSVAAEAVRAWNQAQGLRLTIAILKESEACAAQLEQAEMRMRDEGLSTQADVNQIRSQRLSIQSTLQTQEAQLDNLAYKLNTLAGNAPIPDIRAKPARIGSVPVINKIAAATLRYRPDVQAAEQAVALAGAQLGIAKANLWPQFSLGGGIALTSGQLDTLGLTRGYTNIATSSIGLHIPLLDWFALKEESAARSEEFKATVFDYRQTVVAAWEEARAAARDYEGARAREALAREQAELAEKEIARQESFAQFGTGTQQTVLKARMTMNQLRITAVNERVAALEAWAKLIKATFVAQGQPSA